MPSHPEEPAARGRDLFSAFLETGQLPLLRESVTLFGEAVAATPAGHPDRAGYLSGLGGAMLKLAERTGDAGLLEQAASTQRAAAAAAPPGHPDRAAILANLGTTLEKLAVRTGDPGTLREAAQTCQEAADTAPAGSPLHALCLTNFGSALQTLAGQTGDTGALERAVAAQRAAVAGTPAGDPYLAGRMANLGSVLETLSGWTGDTDTLREAAGSLRSAVAATEAGQPGRADYLSSLGAALQRLFEATMETGTLTEAVNASRAAVTATPADDGDRARRLSNLGSALRTLAERMSDVRLLDEAVDAHLDAVTAAPPGHPDRAGYLSNLGNALLALAERTGDPQALEDGVDMSRAAADAAPTGHADHAANLSKLNGALLIQARTIRDGSARARVLQEAVKAGRAAVAAAPAGQPDRAMYLDNLGAALQAQAGRPGNTALLAEAGRCFAAAATDANAPAAVRISGYQGMVRLPGQAGMSPPEALTAMETAAALLSHAAPSTLARADRQYSLGRLASIAGLAAAAAVAAGQPGRAVELLEQTRGILAADTINARLRTRPDDRTDAFLPAPGLLRLAAEAADGPVVFLYATPSRCDAVILTGDPGEPARVLPLPALSESDAVSQASRLLRARQVALGQDTGLRARTGAHREILDILGWMWDAITGPVLNHLGYATTPDAGGSWPRIRWCPVGVLGYLPLHAAGRHDDITAGRPEPRAVLDRAISSYIPTVRGLSYARAQHPGPGAGSALIIAVTGVLEGVTAEVSALADLIPGAQVMSDPTPDAVLASLPVHSLVHFACHGYANWADPGASMLVLPGGPAAPLTVAAVSAVHLSGNLAYLSACDTTVTTPNFADEAIHITGAFHLAGYAHVIGTLWPVDDTTARDLACDIYRQLTHGGRMAPDTGSAADALHHATRRLREQHPDRPGLWAAHTHTGP